MYICICLCVWGGGLVVGVGVWRRCKDRGLGYISWVRLDSTHTTNEAHYSVRITP